MTTSARTKRTRATSRAIVRYLSLACSPATVRLFGHITTLGCRLDVFGFSAHCIIVYSYTLYYSHDMCIRRVTLRRHTAITQRHGLPPSHAPPQTIPHFMPDIRPPLPNPPFLPGLVRLEPVAVEIGQDAVLGFVVR